MKGKVLLTGGTGFIGSHLAEALVKKGCGLRCLARKGSNVSNLKKTGAEIVIGDILDKNSLEKSLKGIDFVYHLASIVDPTAIKSYADCHDPIVRGTENLARACMTHGIEKFIYFSSVAAIGVRNMEKPVDEKAECVPYKPYGIAKRKTELMLMEFHEKQKFPVSIIRPPTVYGPGDRYNFLIMSRLVKKRSETKKPFYFIDGGRNLASLAYVKNVVNGSLTVGRRGKNGEIYHIADTRPYTTKEVIETIAKALGADIKTVSVPKNLALAASIMMEPIKKMGIETPLYMRKFTELTANFALDISKSRELGYVPEDDFSGSVKKTIEWYGKNGLLL